jgi:hypothetical protein
MLVTSGPMPSPGITPSFIVFDTYLLPKPVNASTLLALWNVLTGKAPAETRL